MMCVIQVKHMGDAGYACTTKLDTDTSENHVVVFDYVAKMRCVLFAATVIPLS